MDIQVNLRALVKVHTKLLICLDDFSAFAVTPDVWDGYTVKWGLQGYSREKQEWVLLWPYYTSEYDEDPEKARACAEQNLDAILEAQIALEEMS